ncbi:MAG: hypothetical protein QM744_04305 [Mesorhizobium sp.]
MIGPPVLVRGAVPLPALVFAPREEDLEVLLRGYAPPIGRADRLIVVGLLGEDGPEEVEPALIDEEDVS